MSETEAFLTWLQDANGYRGAVELPGARYAALNVRPYNAQIITGQLGDRAGFADAW
jgi:hypothetical protein